MPDNGNTKTNDISKILSQIYIEDFLLQNLTNQIIIKSSGISVKKFNISPRDNGSYTIDFLDNNNTCLRTFVASVQINEQKMLRTIFNMARSSHSMPINNKRTKSPSSTIYTQLKQSRIANTWVKLIEDQISKNLNTATIVSIQLSLQQDGSCIITLLDSTSSPIKKFEVSLKMELLRTEIGSFFKKDPGITK